jgi:hypothetical protein
LWWSRSGVPRLPPRRVAGVPDEGFENAAKAAVVLTDVDDVDDVYRE